MHKSFYTFLSVIVLFFSAYTVCCADDLDYLRISLEAKKKIKVAEYMNLSGEENELFWDIYSNYEKEMDTIRREYFNSIREYSDAYKANSVTNEMAGDLLNRYLELEEKKVATKILYAEEFKKALTRKNIARLFQIDHKTDAIIDYELAMKIPLLR